MLWIILMILVMPFVIIFPAMIVSDRADEQSERQLNERKKRNNYSTNCYRKSNNEALFIGCFFFIKGR